ncbi:MAG: permease [Candidatus Bathyarchaeota archaeon]|nr:permease [Candidatus Bathyarchaeota archaeon]
MIADILYITTTRFLYSLPILTIAILAAETLNSGISKEKIGEYLRKTRRNIFGTSLIGLVTPGPLAPYLPLLRVLRDDGLPLPAVVAFITSQTLVGPLRAFLEIDFFGPAFFAYRVAISFFIAVSVGTCYQLFGNHVGLDISSSKTEHER